MTVNNFKVDSAAVTDRGLSKKRPQNEDAYLEMNHLGIFAVADGVGGAQAGDVASQMSVEILAEAFTNLKPNEDAEEMMKLAIERANSAIYQMSRDLPQLATMATTVVALHLAGNIATIGHVGDSRLYLLDGNGDLYRKTDDHSVVEEEVRAGRMTVAQAAIHPSRNIISRALGADVAVEVELKTIMFEPNTTFMLCSDGITRHLSDFELRECLISGDSPADICEKMRSICYERGAEDNLTAVIARVSDVVARAEPAAEESYVPLVEETTAASARPTEATPLEPQNILDLGEGTEGETSAEQEVRNLPPIELEVTEEKPANEPDDQTESVTEVAPEEFPEESPVAYFEQVKSPDEEYPVPEILDDYLSSAEPEPPPIIQTADDRGAEGDEYVLPEAVEKYAGTSFTYDSPEVEESVQSAPQIADVDEIPKTAAEAREKIFDMAEPIESGFVKKLMTGIFTFLFGAVLGAGSFYVATQPGTVENIPAPLPVKTENIALTDFEEARRGVDDDPEKYVRQYEALANKDVEDMFLLGRAYMIVGKYPEAKIAFEEARKRLGDANENNDTVMANDIAAYLAIIANTGAQKLFSEEMKKTGAEDVKTTESPANLPVN